MRIMQSLRFRWGWFASLVVFVVGCGDPQPPVDAGLDGSRPRSDALDVRDAPASDAPPSAPDAWPRCGDGEIEGEEACDDGNRRANDGCSPTCTLECGDGRVSGDERCDVAIAAGEPGACPSSCDDGLVCTADTRIGADCFAECVSTPITLAIDGDGCCPAGATSLVDSDCPVACGNGVLEPGERCDTDIVEGLGRCPSSCDDGLACTRDVLLDDGTCEARCSFSEILERVDGDGCCPREATVAEDGDCSPFCGDGVFSPDDGERCDVAIVGAPGACPTSCDDADVCTDDTLVGSGTCDATCRHVLRPPTSGDGCCPAGANVAIDDDCPVRCGDGVRSPGEACDDGNVLPGDGCSPTCTREPRAYRVVQLFLQDPRVFNASGIDLTPEVNLALRSAISGDSFPADGDIDLSIVLRFDPLDPSQAESALAIDSARCTMPPASTVCRSSAPVSLRAANQSSGACLGPLEGTIPPARVVNTPMAPCFVSVEVSDLLLDLMGTTLRLRDARYGAQYVGDPAVRLAVGLIRAFLPEADAESLRIMDRPLSSLLRASDRDVHEGEPGWWFYLGFTAEPVTYVP